jgi:hypothetical protein
MRPRVLVVHVHFGVGLALAARLGDRADVTLSGPADAAGAVAEHDAVLLCPYLDDAERDALRRACEPGGIPVAQLVDDAGLERPADLEELLARTLAV